MQDATVEFGGKGSNLIRKKILQQSYIYSLLRNILRKLVFRRIFYRRFTFSGYIAQMQDCPTKYRKNGHFTLTTLGEKVCL